MKYFLIIILILAGDQISKWAITSNLSLSESIPLIENVLHITYIRNTGAAFSMFEGQATVLGIFTAVLVTAGLVFIYVKRKSEDRLMMVAVSMIIGGGIGNLIDRAAYGYVVDFIDFRVFPVFNVADICVTLGCALLIVYVLTSGGKKDAG